MLYRLKSPPLNSVRDVGHRRQPMFAKETKKLSFKVYEEQLFRELFEKQEFVTSKAKALYQSTSTYPIWMSKMPWRWPKKEPREMCKMQADQLAVRRLK